MARTPSQSKILAETCAATYATKRLHAKRFRALKNGGKNSRIELRDAAKDVFVAAMKHVSACRDQLIYSKRMKNNKLYMPRAKAQRILDKANYIETYWHRKWYTCFEPDEDPCWLEFGGENSLI